MRCRGEIRVMIALLIMLAAALLPGCIKGTSPMIVEEMELCSATELSISNPLGDVKVSGAELNNLNGAVYIRTEKYVDAYSLFGLASPEAYLGKVMATPVMNDTGRIDMKVQMAPRGLLERLFVRVVPHVNRVVEGPTLISTSAEIQFGDMELKNLPGDVKASVSVGKLIADSPAGVWGEHRIDIDVGELELRVPKRGGFEYDFLVDIGKAESEDLDLDVKHRFMGARAAGLAGTLNTPGLIAAKVKIGSIAVKAQ
ncbi:MAG: hypothetical protein GXY07_04155 [Candidatus Hydrogenedentes bacterium]|mgnify:CR=1 FL=1|nr:hypothetical protein [Candidatus Hydrogenedentota bacterium]